MELLIPRLIKRSSYEFFFYWKGLLNNHHKLINLVSLPSSISFVIRSMLAWVGQCFLDGISPSNMILSECFFQVSRYRVYKSFCTIWFQVLCGLLLFAAPSITKLLHLLTQFSVSILSMWPNHLSPICRMTTKMSCIPSLSHISSEGLHSDRLILYIHLAIYISIRCSLLSQPAMFHCHIT